MEITILNWRVKMDMERVFHDENKLAGMYDKAASRWSRSIDRMGYIEAYNDLFGRLCADGTLAHLPANPAVLDGGIGTGELSLALANHVQVGQWHAVDISEAMLTTAQENLGVSGDFRRANLADLPYDTNTFHMVISAHALEHMPQPAQGFAELLRVLKPGRPFVIVATRLCPVTTVMSLKWNFRPISGAFVRGALEDAGARDIRVQPLVSAGNMAYMSVVYTGLKA